MVTIDQYAYQSRLRDKSPAAKAVFSLGTLAACLCADNHVFSVSVFCLMAYMCIKVSGISSRTFLRLCAIPFWFVIIGALTAAIHVSPSNTGIAALPFFGHYLVLTKAGLQQAVSLFLKSMAGASCVYFLYVSTSVNQMLGLLDKIHAPKLFIELMMMVYRFIFILLGIAEQITVAQRSRLGNNGFVSSMRSVGILASSVFIKAFQRSNDIFNAMESRGYDGSLDYTARLVPAAAKEKYLITVYAVVLTMAVLLCRMAGVS